MNRSFAPLRGAQDDKRTKGYLLLEVIASIAILATVLTAVMRSFAVSLSAIRLSSSFTQAVFLLEEKAGELELTSKLRGHLPEDEVTEGTFDRFQRFRWTLDRKAADPDLWQFGLKVLWKEGKHKEEVSLWSLMPRAGKK